MQNRIDEINTIFKQLPYYLQNQNVYSAMIKYGNIKDVEVYTSITMYDLFLEDILKHWRISSNDFKAIRHSKGMVLRVYMSVFLYSKGYKITDIKKKINMCYQSVVKNFKYFEKNIDNDIFMNDYNTFLIIANKYF